MGSINGRSSMLDAILHLDSHAILNCHDVPENLVENFIEPTPIEIIDISFWAVIENKAVGRR